MKRRALFYSILAIILCVILYTFGMIHEDYNYKEKARRLIIEIENYKKTHKILPNSIEDIKDTSLKKEMTIGPYYDKINDSLYEVYYNIGFDGDRFLYNSAKKKWEWEK